MNCWQLVDVSNIVIQRASKLELLCSDHISSRMVGMSCCRSSDATPSDILDSTDKGYKSKPHCAILMMVQAPQINQSAWLCPTVAHQ